MIVGTKPFYCQCPFVDNKYRKPKPEPGSGPPGGGPPGGGPPGGGRPGGGGPPGGTPVCKKGQGSNFAE